MSGHVSTPLSTTAPQIGSSHADVRRALAVKRGRHPDLLLIDGIWAHQVAVDAGADFDTVFATPERLHTGTAARLADRCRDVAGQSYRVSAKILDRLSDRDRPDGLISLIKRPRWHSEQLRLPDDVLIVVADGLQSPGNLGTVIRTIDACRADLLIVTSPQARPDGDKVFVGSRGLSLSIPQLIINDPSAVISWLVERSISILVADADNGLPYASADLRGPTALILGNERHGPSVAWERFPRIRIPMLGRADSLNVGVSAGVLLYQARAQRAGWVGRTATLSHPRRSST